MAGSPEIYPPRDQFDQGYAKGIAQLVYTRVVSDLDTPVSVYLKLCGGRDDSFLLESVEGGEVLGRHSIIGLDPDLIWQAQPGPDGMSRAQINRTPHKDRSAFKDDDAPMMPSFQSVLDASALEVPSDLAPMAAGLFGYFGYDTVREVEHLPRPPKPGLDIPTAIFIRPRLVVVFDNIRQEMTFATPVRPDASVSANAAYARALERLARGVAGLKNTVPDEAAPRTTPTRHPGAPTIRPTSNTTRPDFFRMVEKARRYIEAGDIFQVVLSQRFSTPFEKPPFALYRSLRRENPSPFLFFMAFPGHALVGSSPEILVRVKDEDVTIRPIAGTRPRGKSPEEDKALAADLLADPKERAEHLMLLDLGRNDVGRTTEIGTVTVTDEFIIERYSHVMHIVSNVVGRLRTGLRPIDAVLAGFPAGTVSGAPKVRAMEIIDELEADARAHYAGAVGYFAAGGDVDTAITLRTAIIKDGILHVQAGAGIVHESNPDAEYTECVNKARALFTAADKA
ncbi:MAG: anthranilate synthase component I [Pseudomonadota bacterium]